MSETIVPGQPVDKLPSTAWRVLIAGLLSNFSVGILYTWSNLKQPILDAYGPDAGGAWTAADLNTPYSVGGMVFAIFLIVAGTLQDKLGPKIVMIAGVLLVGLGTMASGLVAATPMLFYIAFGGLVGTGLAFVYACPRPAAMKWFHPSMKGLINGIVVAGFGLGALWLSPLEKYLLNRFDGDVRNTLLVMGGLILCLGIPAAMNVVDPPEGYRPPEPEVDPDAVVSETKVPVNSVSVGTAAKTPQAWMLLGVYALFCSAGALVISNVNDIIGNATSSLGWAETMTGAAGLAVIVASVGNATGRGSGGVISDALGRRTTYFIIHALAAANMFFMSTQSDAVTLTIGVIIATLCYGAALSVTPSIVADYFGLESYGANYGLVYYGWGLSLIIGPQIASRVSDFKYTYYAAIALIAISAVLVFFLRKPKFYAHEIQGEILDPDYIKQ